MTTTQPAAKPPHPSPTTGTASGGPGGLAGLQAEFAQLLASSSRHSHEDSPGPGLQAWDESGVGRIESFLAAAKYQNRFEALVAFVQEEHPELTVEDLTVRFLEHQDKGKLIRRATLVYAEKNNLETHIARQRLLSAVIMHHHGHALMAGLRDGSITPAAADFAVRQLKSIPDPQPNHDPHGEPWEPRELAEAQRAADIARNQLDNALGDLARQQPREAELKNAARRLRDQHHPESPHQRHTKAVKRRHLRMRNCADGMAAIEAYVSAGTAETMMETARTFATRLKTKGLARGRTENQLLADAFAELVAKYGLHGLAVAADTHCADGVGEAAAALGQAELPGIGSLPDLSPDDLAASRKLSPATMPAPAGPNIVLLLTPEQFVKLGGHFDRHRMGFLKEAFPQWYAQAERNRCFYETPPEKRRTEYPEGILEAGATATVLGTGTQLATAEAAKMTEQAAMMSILLTDPISGFPLGTSKRTRRVSPDVAQLIFTRDQRCRYPGCTVPGQHCQIDHVDEFSAGGATSYENSALLCRQHHEGKTAGWFTMVKDQTHGDGALRFGDKNHQHQKLATPPLPMDPKAWQAYSREVEDVNPPPF